jgi:acetyl esterase/lipase
MKLIAFVFAVALAFTSNAIAQTSSCSVAQTELLHNSVLIPELTEAPNCEHTLDATYGIAYTNSGNPKHAFDLYRPAVNPAPVVIWIHGGGWQSGERTNIQQVKRLVCAGYAVASISYRLSGEAVFPAQIHDVKSAIRYIRANATSLNVKGNRIITFGSSAGGHLAALAATSRDIPELEDLSTGYPLVPSTVQAAIAWYGPSDFSQMDNQLVEQGCSVRAGGHTASTSAESKLLGCVNGLSDPDCLGKIDSANPVSYVSTSTPPIQVLHGTLDCTVPVGQSVLLKNAIEELNKCVIYRTVEGASHGNRGTFPWTSVPVQNTTVDFLRKVIR